jgi:cytochrome b561
MKTYATIWQPEQPKADNVKSTRSTATWFVLVVLCFWLLIVPAANAYVDPGTGSYVFQVLIGVFLGAAVAVKVFWRRIWGFVTRKPAPSASTPATGRDEED